MDNRTLAQHIHALVAGVNGVLKGISIVCHIERQEEKVLQTANAVREKQQAGLLVTLRIKQSPHLHAWVLIPKGTESLEYLKDVICELVASTQSPAAAAVPFGEHPLADYEDERPSFSDRD